MTVSLHPQPLSKTIVKWADVLNRAIKSRSFRLQRLKGPQATIALERDPKLEQTVDALIFAAKLWREFRNQKNVGAVGGLSKELAAFRESAKNERPRKGEELQA